MKRHDLRILLALSLLCVLWAGCDDVRVSRDPNEDSDGDGYTNAEEQHAGTDPDDAEDRIYQGGWPYNMNKDEMVDPGWDSEAGEGAMLPHFIAVDQYGDSFDFYDLAGHGTKTVLDMGTIWCEPCKGMAAYLSTGDTSHVEEWAWWDSDYEHLYDMVQDGDIFWVTVLFSESEASGPADQEDCEGWHEDYPNDKIPVLADTELLLHDWIGVTSYPVLNLLDENLELEIHETGGPYAVLNVIPDMP